MNKSKNVIDDIAAYVLKKNPRCSQEYLTVQVKHHKKILDSFDEDIQFEELDLPSKINNYMDMVFESHSKFVDKRNLLDYLKAKEKIHAMNDPRFDIVIDDE